MFLTFYFAYFEAVTCDQRIDDGDIPYDITCNLTKRMGWEGHGKENEHPRKLDDFLKEILEDLDKCKYNNFDWENIDKFN